MRRAITLIFIFLMVSVSFSAIAVNGMGDDTINYTLKIYDSQGRLLNSSYQSIQQFARVKVYTFSLFGLKKTLIADIEGKHLDEATFKVNPNILKVYIEFYWIGHAVYKDVIDLLTAQKDSHGNYVIAINLPFTPSIPIAGLQVEPIQVSADMHQIQSNYYNIKFGVGDHQNKIEISMGGNTYLIPVNLDFSKGGNSETKPFRFLAQSTKGYVQGEEKWLIWTTAYYWSAVRTKLVGDNMLLVVWTYGYTDIKTAWVSTVVSAILAGAVVGATTGIGSISMAGIAGLGSAILWAVHPELMKFAGTTGIGVVAGIFTPRYFIIQGVSGMGTNETSATISMDNIPSSTRMTSGNIAYEIYSQSNTIQVGFTKDYGTAKSISLDFESGAPEWTGSFSLRQNYAHSGLYSLYVGTNKNAYYNFTTVKAGQTLKVDFAWYSYTTDTGQVAFSTEIIYYHGGTKQTIASSDNSASNNRWGHYTLEGQFTATEDGIVGIKLNGYYYHSLGSYYDDIEISWRDATAYRYIFDTGGHSNNAVRYMFGTIPTFAPTSTGTNIQNRYTLIAIDMADRHGMLALDWQSRRVAISPARILIKTDVWSETAWLLATDDKDGFKDVNFVISPTDWFIYRTDIQTYYYFTSPDNWTWQHDWTPLVANNTMIYVPSDIGIPPWEQWKWQINGWWEDVGTWGHLALMGLGLLIIFIILLILAPQIIILLIKLIAWIIRGIIKGVGQIGKAFKGKRRR